MPPSVTRTIAITYGSLTIGGTSDYLLDGPFRWTTDYERFELEQDVVVAGTSDADFQSKCATLEAAFRVPRQNLTVVFGSTPFIALTHSGNTGYSAEPEAVKVGDDVADTGRSRKYRVRVRGEQPADLTGQAGRRFSSRSIEFLPSAVRRVRIAGRYTVLAGGGDALAQYEGAIDAYANGFLAGLGGTWELVDETRGPMDDPSKNIDFSRTYEELIYNQAQGLLDHAKIKQHRVHYVQDAPGPGDSPRSGGNARRLATLTATYDTWVDKSETDLGGFFRDTIRPYLISEVRAKFQPQHLALVTSHPDFDVTLNRITGTLVFQMVLSRTTFEFTKEIAVEDQTGKILTPTWSGNVYHKHEDDGPARKIRTISTREVRLDEDTEDEPSVSQSEAAQQRRPFVLTNRRVDRQRVVVGLQTGDDPTIPLIIERIVEVDELALRPPRVSITPSTGGGSPVPTARGPTTPSSSGGTTAVPR